MTSSIAEQLLEDEVLTHSRLGPGPSSACCSSSKVRRSGRAARRTPSMLCAMVAAPWPSKTLVEGRGRSRLDRAQQLCEGLRRERVGSQVEAQANDWSRRREGLDGGAGCSARAQSSLRQQRGIGRGGLAAEAGRIGVDPGAGTRGGGGVGVIQRMIFSTSTPGGLDQACQAERVVLVADGAQLAGVTASHRAFSSVARRRQICRRRRDSSANRALRLPERARAVVAAALSGPRAAPRRGSAGRPRKASVVFDGLEREEAVAGGRAGPGGGEAEEQGCSARGSEPGAGVRADLPAGVVAEPRLAEDDVARDVGRTSVERRVDEAQSRRQRLVQATYQRGDGRGAGAANHGQGTGRRA